MQQSVTVPTDLVLSDSIGRPVRLGDVLTGHRATVVQLVRYFGCLPCQEWAVGLDQAATGLAENGIGAAVIGGSADYQARWLREEKGVTIPLLLDPDHQVREVVGAIKPLGLRLLDPRGAVAYAASLRHGYRPQAVTRDTRRSPGVVVLDRGGRVLWQPVGARIGDYPPLPEVLAVAESLG